MYDRADTSVGDWVIERALAAVYPGIASFRFGIGGSWGYPLAGFHALYVDHHQPHWLVVSRGFSELDEKLRSDPAVSGFGFELTCRVPAPTPEQTYGWVANWMQRIADRLAATGSSLAPAQHLSIGDPEREDELCGVVLTEDVALPTSRSPFGRVSFLQMVGLFPREVESLEAWSATGFLELVRERDPLLVSNPDRSCWMRDSDFAARIWAGIERDGSSTATLAGMKVVWFKRPTVLEVHVAATGVESVLHALHRRLRHNRMVMLLGSPREIPMPDGTVAENRQTRIVLLPETGGSGVEYHDGEPWAVVRMGPDATSQLAHQLAAQLGSGQFGSVDVPALPGVRFVVARPEHLASPQYPW